MVDPGYYSSERFIEDVLIKRVEEAIPVLYDTWKRQKRIDPFAIFWPASVVQDSSGIDIEGPCLYELGEDKGLWRTKLADGIRLTDAYALVFIQQREDGVLVILESQHGAVNWKLPILRSAGDLILGRAARSKEGEHVGLLWRPTSLLS
jgi:hypothetical protein